MELRNGKLIHDGIVLGSITEETKADDDEGVDIIARPSITLNLGWCDAADVHVRVLGNPDVDKRRVMLDR